FDVKGKLLKVEQITPVENYSTIDLSRYPQGIYYLHIGNNVFKVVRK
ncbi:MAG: T9SS type A sorting domain-containing protein, partial [Bacteroidales bacterium]|nr:T9SS type A sorting domain-containing protein [Bacteroidales bacterium]